MSDEVINEGLPEYLKAAAVFGVPYTWEEVAGPCRPVPLARIRQALCFFLMTHPNYRGLTTVQVGNLINRDHTTAIYSRDFGWGMMHGARRDPGFWSAYDRLLAAEVSRER
jgi:hypothetical protein